ncbi:terminase small subunit [Ruminococcus sp.]|uniref:terminase small subunit n=1 Tax=Ruminococcus sp. TaxID=41978 RepID=UPI0025FBF96D|nr:terminase small subunit [Ruminococcus sp.]
MTERSKLFARLFFHLRNLREAAQRLGVERKNAENEGAALLHSEGVAEEIRRLENEDVQTTAYVKTGLSRLAFGCVNDAVRLIFDENVTAEEVMGYDFFNVSEIKKNAKGDIEVKFFDRQRALEKLVELAPNLGESSETMKLMEKLYGKDGGGL